MVGQPHHLCEAQPRFVCGHNHKNNGSTVRLTVCGARQNLCLTKQTQIYADRCTQSSTPSSATGSGVLLWLPPSLRSAGKVTDDDTQADDQAKQKEPTNEPTT